MATITAIQAADVKWEQMTAAQKVVWWGKLFVALCTFGFVYPRIMDPRLRD